MEYPVNVSMANNVIFAHLIDAGQLLIRKIAAKEIRSSWLMIEIEVF